MKHHPELCCLLLSLFDHFSNNMIWKSITKHYQNLCLNENNQECKTECLPSLFFYDSESKNYIFVIVEGYVWKFKFDQSSLEILKDNNFGYNNYEDEHLNFTKLSNLQDVLGEYQLEKDSIIGKIKIEELEKQKFKFDEIAENQINVKEIEESVRELINNILANDPNKTIEEPVIDFVKRITNIEESENNHREWKTKIEKITKIKKEEKDHNKWKNKIEELRKDFTNRIIKIEEFAKDPDKFKIKIGKKHLQIDDDLIRLFGADEYSRLFRNDVYRDDLNQDKKDIKILAGKLLNNNNIVILTEIGIFIFHLNKDLWLISLSYFHHMYYMYQPEKVKHIRKMIGFPKDKNGWVLYVENNDEYFLKYGALLNFVIKKYDLELINDIYKYVKKNKENFLKYGSALLICAIKMHDLELIDDIYNECLNLFEQDLENNEAFLSIINISMPLLNKYYPEYITRYSSDTNLIIDSSDYKIEYLDSLYLHPFSNIEIVDLTPSIRWTKYTCKVNDMYYDSNRINQRLIGLYFKIEALIFFSILPISFPIFHILNYFHIINEIYVDGLSKCYYKTYYFISDLIFPEKLKPTITFIIPYIKFVSYPQDYSWWELIKPKPSPFVETINREIYKTWNGEALINFKWNSYGKFYYAIILIMFTALLGCFTAATTLSDGYISENIRKQLLITSIILGFTHFLLFEFRQFIYNPIKWFRDPWNYFGKNKFVCLLFVYCKCHQIY